MPPHPTHNKMVGIGFLIYTCGHVYMYAVDIICVYVYCMYTFILNFVYMLMLASWINVEYFANDEFHKGDMGLVTCADV